MMGGGRRNREKNTRVLELCDAAVDRPTNLTVNVDFYDMLSPTTFLSHGF